MPTATVRAYAKINLALSVGGPITQPGPTRGFHPIASWFHAVDLYDDLTLTPHDSCGQGTELEIRWASTGPRPPRESPIDWPVEKDLAFRAHAALERATGRRLGVHAVLSKRIPVGGGLGGGSSDAAAMLLGLNRVFNLGLPTWRLAELGATLGSDVPFFVDDAPAPHDPSTIAPPRPALVTGLGERLERVPAMAAWAVLLFPPFGCPTGPVYKAFDAWLGTGAGRAADESRVRGLIQRARSLESDVASRVPPPHRRGTAAAAFSAELFNDLAAPAETVAPGLAALRQRIAAMAGAPVHVTGSGSTMFMLAADGEEAKRVAGMAATIVSTAAVRLM